MLRQLKADMLWFLKAVPKQPDLLGYWENTSVTVGST